MESDRKGWTQRTVPSTQASSALSSGTASGSGSPPATETWSHTYIGDGAVFEGTLRIRESIRIDTEFRGQLESEGKVIVGEEGSVVGDIRAREVEIRGAVQGDIRARRELVMRAGARLHGSVETPCFEMERHAFFNGTTKMERPEVALRESRSAADTPPPTAPTV